MTEERTVTGKNSRDYNSAYYAEHKGEIAEHRRQKYSRDPEYRQKALLRERAWREAKKKAKFDAVTAELAAAPVFKLDGAKHREIVVKLAGEPQVLVSTAAVAAALGVAVRTVTCWLETGKLPGANFCTEVLRKDRTLLRRWFTLDYVQRMYALKPQLQLGTPVFFAVVKREFSKEFNRDRVRAARSGSAE